MSLAARWASDRLAPVLWPLFPLHALFVAASTLRRQLFRLGWLKSQRLPVPVVVVGNITVGGAGKTPLTLALAAALRARGFNPGIISRGYRGKAASPRAVAAGDDPAEVGDEPLLLAQNSGVPVWIGRHRPAAGALLLTAQPQVDVILSDDGLQHYALARDVEIVLFDARGVGNGWRLPLGPLRESLARLPGVDALVFNGHRLPALQAVLQRQCPDLPAFDMHLSPAPFFRLDAPEVRALPNDLAGKNLHAVAGIGDPERFFATLRGLGLPIIPHAFPDHHVYSAAELDFGPHSVRLMTTKDAVKCARLALGETWVLPVEADVPPALIELIVEKIRGRKTP